MIGRVRPVVAGATTIGLTLFLVPVLPFLGDLSEDWVTSLSSARGLVPRAGVRMG